MLTSNVGLQPNNLSSNLFTSRSLYKIQIQGIHEALINVTSFLVFHTKVRVNIGLKKVWWVISFNNGTTRGPIWGVPGIQGPCIQMFTLVNNSVFKCLHSSIASWDQAPKLESWNNLYQSGVCWNGVGPDHWSGVPLWLRILYQMLP